LLNSAVKLQKNYEMEQKKAKKIAKRDKKLFSMGIKESKRLYKQQL